MWWGLGHKAIVEWFNEETMNCCHGIANCLVSDSMCSQEVVREAMYA